MNFLSVFWFTFDTENQLLCIGLILYMIDETINTKLPFVNQFEQCLLDT
jgi:hypothetical protein